MLTLNRRWPAVIQGGKKSTLSTIPNFKNLPSDAFPAIESHMIEKKYAKRESIFLEEDRAESIWFVKEGCIKEIHNAGSGRSHTLCIVGANGLFGVSAFSGGLYGFQSLAETDSTVISFPIQYFRALMEKYPSIGTETLNQISTLLRRSKDMRTFSQESAEKRLLHALVELTREFGNTIPLNRREIAEIAGTAVETCIRACVRLEKAGLLKSAPGQIIVKDVDDLMDRMEEF